MWIKERLLTPGPTPIAESTRLAMAIAPGHHRSADFSKLMSEVLEHLRWLWDTEDDVLLITGSGTAGMEAALSSALGAGDRVLVITGGKFGERWLEILTRLGAAVDELKPEWGESASVDELERMLDAGGDYAALVMVASETSTGKLHPVAEMAAAFRARHSDSLVVVDGITAVGCVDLSMKRDGLDVLVSGSQKAFGLPPGMAMVGVSERAWQKIDSRRATHTYLDLSRERKQTATGQTAWTPNVQLVLGLAEVMRRWRVAGRDALFAHNAQLAAATRAAVAALGLELFGSGTPSPALTSVAVPEGIDGPAVASWMKDRAGVQIAGGQDHVKGKIWRIGHLGPVDWAELVAGISALGMALVANGYEVDPASGVSAALASLAGPLSAEDPQRISP